MRPTGGPEKLQRRRQRTAQLLNQGLHPVEGAQRVGVDRCRLIIEMLKFYCHE